MKKWIAVLLLPAMLAGLSGCPVNLNRVPGDTERLTDPQTGYHYYRYVPSWHNNDQKWPVIVTCHGTNPFDTAYHQVLEWRGLAEQYGLLIVSPELKGTNSGGTILPEDQIRRQRDDEQAILSITQKTLTSFNGDPNRVFMVGWSGGGLAVYYAGLRNPQIFRALAIRMGSFDERTLPDVADRLDPYQPVFIFLAAGDFPAINAQCREAYRWLTDHGMKRVTLQEVPGIHERRPKVAFTHFKDITERYAFVRLQAVKDLDGDPLKVQFYANVDPKPLALVWDFGDQKISNDLAPRHRYAKPGVYDVTVTIITANSSKTQRKIKLDLADKQLRN